MPLWWYMKNKIIFATNNADKFKEIREIMGDLGLDVVAMGEAGIVLDIEETGKTFLENAVLKARAVHALAPPGALVLADDSGLAIDYLDGEPGVYSARYMGEQTPYSVKNQNLIDRLDGVPDDERSARFVCAIAAVLPDGRLLNCEGVMEGRIAYAESGDNGFGYDPIFYLPEYGMTSAALPREKKNQISHRAQALYGMKRMLVDFLEGR